MSELSVGALFATVELTTVSFDRGYARVVKSLAQLAGEFEGAAGSTGALDRGLTSVGAAADKAGAGMTTAERAAAKVAASQAKATASADRHAKAEAELAAVMERTVGASGSMQQATLREVAAKQRLIATSAEAGSAEARQATETARLASAQAGAIGATQRLAAAQREGAVASRGLTGGLAGTLKMAGELGLLIGAFELVKKGIDITKEANDFQRSLVQVQTTANVTAAEVHKASGALLDLAGPTAAAPAELATAWYHAKSVGLDYAKSIDTTRIAAEGARVGHADLEETMNALTSTVASGIPGVKDMAGAMGQLIATVGTGDMKLSDLNDALSGGILTVVKGYGLSLTDVGAALATFGDNNIRGANAATMLRLAVQSMAVPAVQGRDTLHKLGLATDQLAKDMQEGGLNKAILDLKSHLDKAGVSGKQTGAVLTEVFGKRAGPGLAVLVGQVDRLESKFKILRASGASFDEKWKATTQTASFALASLGHGAEAAGIKLTEKLGPPIASVATAISTTLPHALSTLGSILGPTIHLIGVGLAGAWTAVSAVLGVVGGALGAVAGFLSRNKALATGVATAVVGMWAAFKAYQIARFAIVAVVALVQRLGASVGLMATRAKTSFATMSTGAAAMRVGMGVAAVGVGLIAAAWQINSQRTAEAKQRVEDYTAALNQSKGAIDASVRATLIQKLASDGAYDAAKKYGVAQNDVTDAALGSIPAWHRLMAATNGNYDAVNAVTLAVGRQGGALGKAQQHYKQATTAENHAGAAAARHAAAVGDANKVLSYSIDSQGRLVGKMVASGSAIDNTTSAMARQTLASGILKNAIDRLNGVNETVEQTNDALTIGIGQLAAKTSLAQNANGKMSTSLDKSTVAGAQNRTMLVGIIDQAKAAAQAVADHARQQGKTLPQALAAGNAALKRNEDSIRAAAKAAGLNKDQVDALILSIGKLANIKADPKIDADTSPGAAKIKTYQDEINKIKQYDATHVDADTHDGQRRIQYLQQQIDNLRDKDININVRANVDEARSKLNSIVGGYNITSIVVDHNGTAHGNAVGTRAAFGRKTIPPNTRFTVGEGPGAGNTWEGGVTDSQGRASIFSNSQAKAMGFPAPKAYAGGTDNSGKNYAAIAALLKAMGATRAGIAGWLGNTKIESGGRTTAYNPGENAHGFQQWEGGRLGTLQNQASKLGVGISSQAAQLATIKYELTHGYGSTLNYLRHATSARDAAAYVDANYEVSSGSARGARQSAAESFYNSGVSKGAGGSYAGSSGAGKGGTVNGVSYSSALGYHNAQVRAAAQAAKDAADRRTERRKATGSAISSANKAAHLLAGDVQVHNGVLSNHAASRSDVQQSLWDAEGALRKAGASRRFIRGLEDENKAILRHVGLRNHAGAQLVAANKRWVAARKVLYDDRVTFKGAITGSLDISTLGQGEDGRVTAGSALAASHQAVTRAKAYVTVMHKLIGMGVFPPRFLRTLLAQGPSALPEAQAYASMNPSELKSLAADNKQLYSLGKELGTAGSVRLDQPAVNDARHAQRFWQKRENYRERQVQEEFVKLGKQFETSLQNGLSQMHIDVDAKLKRVGSEWHLLMVESENKSRHRGPAKRS